MYKMYTNILEVDCSGVIVKEQNGFRKTRSTVDHLTSLTSIVETRKMNGKSTFCAFIDFRKAFNSINRDLLCHKLVRLGLSSKMLAAVKSLYSSIASCVRLNGCYTDWFSVTTGLRQGCASSTILFNQYLLLKSFHKGIIIEKKFVFQCMQSDIVLIAENENNLQYMLNMLNNLCESNCMSVNVSKSNIVHFRSNDSNRSKFVFTCGSSTVELCNVIFNTWILV